MSKKRRIFILSKASNYNTNVISKHRGGFQNGKHPSCWTPLAMLNITSNIKKKKTVYNTLQEHVNEYTFMYQYH